ncbi:eCIS core domain-containing protein [Streptomyces erythrochromogenes]|uniref:eCIS core domain-containing protein n=1 Tax=Streptomyces erythrochromogenes TaxID=285574 RepID=UPI003F4CB5A1
MSPRHPRPTQKTDEQLLQATRRSAAPQQEAAAPVGLMGLQASAGNAAVVQMLRRAGHGQDEEQEQHRHTDGCGHQQSEQHAVQRSAVHDVLRAPGRPMDAATRSDMEARLGADFSDVRIHDNSAAKASAAEVGARAYTSGSHVVIGAGGSDKHTLAHELTHVIQQRQGPVAGTDNGSGLKVSDPSDRFEREAEANASRVMAPGHRAATVDVQRHVEPSASTSSGSHHAVQRVANPQDLLTVEHWENQAGLGGSTSAAAKSRTKQIAASKKNAKGWKASKPPRRIDDVIATVGPKLLADLAKKPADSGRMELFRSMSFEEAHSALTYWGDTASRAAMMDYIEGGGGTAKEFRENGYSGLTIGAHLGDQGQADAYYNTQGAPYAVQLKFVLKPGAHELLFNKDHMALGPGYKNDLIREATGGGYQNASANEGTLGGYVGVKAEDNEPYSLGIAQGANTKNGRELGASQLLFQLFVENVELVKNRSGQELPGAAAQQELTA